MICHLCKRETELKKSHVIPEFAYKALYDSNHKFHILSTIKVRHKPMEQKGIRERLLCGNCEQQLSVYEKYAREVLLGGVEINVRDEGELLYLSGINYEKFKLFQLSILWRASISCHPMFSRVNLGPHEERIRNMIRNSAPGKKTDYPCTIFRLSSKSGLHEKFIDQPRQLHIDGHTTYRFIFTGFMWSYYVSSHKLPPLLKHAPLNEAGSMIIGRGYFEEFKEFNKFFSELH